MACATLAPHDPGTVHLRKTPMKTETQRSPELTQLAGLLDGMSIAMMTTRDAANGFASRPMAPLLMDADGAIWFYTDSHSGKTAQLDAINLAFSDEGSAKYVSASGHGELLHDRRRIEELWTAFAKPWFPEGPQSPNLALLKFVPHSAETWDAPSSRMVRMLAMAASAIAGKPIGLGDHDTLNNLSRPASHAAPASALTP